MVAGLQKVLKAKRIWSRLDLNYRQIQPAWPEGIVQEKAELEPGARIARRVYIALAFIWGRNVYYSLTMMARLWVLPARTSLETHPREEMRSRIRVLLRSILQT